MCTADARSVCDSKVLVTTEPNMIDNLTVKENFSASDHQMTECELIAKTVVNEVIKTR